MIKRINIWLDYTYYRLRVLYHLMRDQRAYSALLITSVTKSFSISLLLLIIWNIMGGANFQKNHSKELSMLVMTIVMIRLIFFDERIYTNERFEMLKKLWANEMPLYKFIKLIGVIMTIGLPVILYIILRHLNSN